MFEPAAIRMDDVHGDAMLRLGVDGRHWSVAVAVIAQSVILDYPKREGTGNLHFIINASEILMARCEKSQPVHR